MADDTEGTIDEKQERRIRMGQTIRVVAALAVVALLGLFAAINTADVQIDYLFGDVEAPMIIVILVSAVGGFLIGWISRLRRE
ncbi:MAG: LapA family protein [Acidimicrobiia bacterium]|nr:LapA family protein [Acidimicrobiia bacterium]